MKKRTNVIGVLIIIIGVIIVASIFIYGLFIDRNTPSYFNSSKKNAAETLYNNIMGRDLDGSYPKTPDEIMSLNLDIIKMIYGNFIVDESLYEGLIEQQRKLFTKELNDQNPMDTQLDTVLTAVRSLNEQKISHYSFSQLPTIYNSIETNTCYIRVEQTFNNSEKYYWEYQLERNETDRKWRIARWNRTDENYDIIAE